MGTNRVWFFKPSSATWTHVKIYRSSSYGGNYTNIATQALTDDNEQYYDDTSGTSSHYYKIAFWDGANESSLSEAVKAGDVRYYTTLSRIKGYLQLPADFSSSTTPTDSEVVDIMQETDAEIDRSTGHAWRQRYSYDPEDSNDYEYHDLAPGEYNYLTGLPVYLGNRKIKTLNADMGDSLEVWNGSAWENWLTAKTEGRGSDFWIDYANGVMYIRTSLSLFPVVKGLRLRYRYGDETVPKEIRKLATIMAGLEILANEDYSANFPEGGEGTNIRDKISRDSDKAERLMAKFTEFKTL